MNSRQYAEKLAKRLRNGDPLGLVRVLARKWNEMNARKVPEGEIDPVCVVDRTARRKDKENWYSVFIGQGSGRIGVGNTNIYRNVLV